MSTTDLPVPKSSRTQTILEWVENIPHFAIEPEDGDEGEEENVEHGEEEGTRVEERDEEKTEEETNRDGSDDDNKGEEGVDNGTETHDDDNHFDGASHASRDTAVKALEAAYGTASEASG